MPVFSLPSPWGIGTLGAAAREFADFLQESGHSCWQVLPMGPTSYGDSPYQAFSSYAGNPYFIDLDELCAQGLLKREEYQNLEWGSDPQRVDYALLHRQRFPVLRLACRRLWAQREEEVMRFCHVEKIWLEDYALFMALKGSHGDRPWSEWPRPLRLREPEALEKAREELQEEIRFWSAVQFLFFEQWDALKRYVNGKGITIIGDIPIYVPLDSADVWASPEQFQLDGEGRPTEVAGCPPDAFSDDGQLWGNPLFDWEGMKADRYRWWVRRIFFQFRLYDTLRIDHFRGFESYYAIPAGEKTARRGRWRPGPGKDFFRVLAVRLGKRDMIAEDLGYLTEEVHQLLAYTGYPGMKVLEFAFGDKPEDSAYMPHNHIRNCVVYTGTHDNDTVNGWLNSCSRAERSYARRYMRLNSREGYHWGVMCTAWASIADLAMVQFQDILGLGSEARINTPATVGRNWQWRTLPGYATGRLVSQIHRQLEICQRLPRDRKPARAEDRG